MTTQQPSTNHVTKFAEILRLVNALVDQGKKAELTAVLQAMKNGEISPIVPYSAEHTQPPEGNHLVRYQRGNLHVWDKATWLVSKGNGSWVKPAWAQGWDVTHWQLLPDF